MYLLLQVTADRGGFKLLHDGLQIRNMQLGHQYSCSTHRSDGCSVTLLNCGHLGALKHSGPVGAEV